MKNNIHTKPTGTDRQKTRLCKCLFLFLMLVIGYGTAHSQCIKGIIPVENEQIKYRMRHSDPRCEGLYQKPVSAIGSLEVVGLVKGKFRFKLHKDEVIEISSPFVRNQPVQVCALGIPVKTYYRMDAKIDKGMKLRWPAADVICSQKLYAGTIGIFGWIGTGTKITYTPVSVSAKLETAPKDDKINLYLRASTDVERVKWRSCDVVSGTCSGFGKWEEIRLPYRTGEAVRITLPPSQAGELCVDVAAKEKNSARWLRKKDIRVIVKERK